MFSGFAFLYFSFIFHLYNPDVPLQINLTVEFPTILTSPDYPSIYPNNILCTWLIVSPPETLISVQVIEFQVEKHIKAEDVLYIGNGLNYTVDENGYKLPRDAAEGDAGKVRQIISSGPELWLVFKTDYSQGSEKGFKLQLKVINQTGES